MIDTNVVVDKRRKFKSALFTVNNPLHNEEPRRWMELSDNIKGIVWQLEKGEQGTQHLQGYAQFKVPTRLTAVIKFSPGAHWEPKVFGDDADMIAYCQKEETRLAGPWTIGDISVSVQGRRSDVAVLIEGVRSGKTDKQLIEDDATAPAWLKYQAAVGKARTAIGVNVRTKLTRGIILWGVPMTGKSYRARKFCIDNGKTFAVLPQKQSTDANPWFDGCDKEVLIIDEMSGHTMKPDLFCQLLDEYQVSVPVKGNTIDFNAEYIIFTSNRNPREWWAPDVLARNPGVARRLSQCIIREFTAADVYTPPTPVFPAEVLSYSFGGKDDGVNRTAPSSSSTASTALAPAVQQQQLIMDDRGRHIIQQPEGVHADTFRPSWTSRRHQSGVSTTYIPAPRPFTPQEWMARQQLLRKRVRSETGDVESVDSDDDQ